MVRSHIVFIVPAKDEEKTILQVIQSVLKYGDLILINDGSVDQTYEIAKKYDIKIINNIDNIGYQKSIIKGLSEAKKLNYKYAITFDADNQHSEENINLFINKLDLNYDLVIGERSFFNRISEKILSIFTSFLLGTHDILSGMKAYKLDSLKPNYLVFKKNTYCAELTFRIIKNKHKYKF